MDYGYVTFELQTILDERGISKNRLCKDLDIPRTNLNRYCQNKNTRIDTGLICKLCNYLDIEVGDLIIYHGPAEETKE